MAEYFTKDRPVTQPASAASAAPASQPTGSRGSNAFTRKLGPLPVWGWMGIGLAIALVYYFWKQNKKSASAASPTSTPDQTTAASQIPQFINEVNETTPITENINNSSTNQQTNTQTVSTPPASTGAAPPPKPGGPPSPQPTPKYITVTVGKFPSGAGGSPTASQNSFGPGTAAWNSTLWGIATHYNVKGGYQTLASLNHIANPNLIYPGQKILVPTS